MKNSCRKTDISSSDAKIGKKMNSIHKEEKKKHFLNNGTANDSEINTYDSPSTSDAENRPRGSKEASAKNKKAFSFIKSLSSTAAIITVFLTVIFAASELFDFLLDDIGTGNMILKRFFSSSIVDGNNGNICDLIIKQSFIDIGTHKSDPLPTTPESSSSESISESKVVDGTATGSISSEDSTREPDISTAPDYKKCPILPMDMSLISYGKGFIYNDTALTPDVFSLYSKELSLPPVSEDPLVLIIHTHATESYMPEGAYYYIDDGAELARTCNTNENMVAVGSVFARVLTERGIPALHCTILHDKESYRESYRRAAESIAKYLREYPSIKYVFDLHRDSIMRSNGELISAVASIDGKNHAQIMAVVGSGYDGWENNLSLALKLRERLNSQYTNICRPTCLRESEYNQYMAEFSIILEIGTSGNTLSEALAAAELTAISIAELIKS